MPETSAMRCPIVKTREVGKMSTSLVVDERGEVTTVTTELRKEEFISLISGKRIHKLYASGWNSY